MGHSEWLIHTLRRFGFDKRGLYDRPVLLKKPSKIDLTRISWKVGGLQRSKLVEITVHFRNCWRTSTLLNRSKWTVYKSQRMVLIHQWPSTLAQITLVTVHFGLINLIRVQSWYESYDLELQTYFSSTIAQGK